MDSLNKIEKYFQTKAISNSLLSSVQNPRWLKIKMDNPDTEDEDKVHFRIGSALDCQLTSPELWEEQFLVIDATRPMGFMGKFIDNLPGGLDPYLSDESLYKEAYDKAGYKMSITKVIEKLWKTPELLEYYLATRNVDRTKQILSKEEYDIVLKAKELLLANEFTEMYFRPLDGIYELMTQVPIYFKYYTGDILPDEEEDCKALLDGILIDHQTKTIQPYDLKTTGKSVYDFPKAYLEYGYYRQAAFYTMALESWESPIRKLVHEQGYEVLPFIFIVVETKITSTNAAVIYKVSTKDMIRGFAGGNVNGRYYKGIEELITAYKFHRDNDYWNMPMDLVNNKGRINLNIFDND